MPSDIDPDEVGEEIVKSYENLWCELTREETFGPDERFKLDERLHTLNDLGFDVEEISSRRAATATGCSSTRASSSRAITVIGCCG